MLASYEDAQDLTQETFLRAWAKRESFQGRASLRTWLYRIATNACLDFLEKWRDHAPIPTELQGAAGTDTEVLYLEPWPTASRTTRPSMWWRKETIGVGFIVAVQHLPAPQRAVLRNAYAINMLAPDTLTRRRERIAGIHGLSIDTIELYERNMIDELTLRLVHGSYR